MWLGHRVTRAKTKLSHLSHYLKTLHQANRVAKQTQMAKCRQPVLLLYGFGATRRSLSILESRLRNDGFDVFSINLGGLFELFNTAPIDSVAKKVAEKIESLCRRYRLPKLSIIGYSKGGLIGRYYVTCLGGSKRVQTLITLATPHQGNPWVMLSHLLGVGLFSKGLRQMLPRSPFLKQLNQAPYPEQVYMVSLASAKDRQCPPKYCRLPPPSNSQPIYNIVLDNLYHSDFVIKSKAYQEILKHLKAGCAVFSQNDAGGELQSLPKTTEYSHNNKSTATARQTP